MNSRCDRHARAIRQRRGACWRDLQEGPGNHVEWGCRSPEGLQSCLSTKADSFQRCWIGEIESGQQALGAILRVYLNRRVALLRRGRELFIHAVPKQREGADDWVTSLAHPLSSDSPTHHPTICKSRSGSNPIVSLNRQTDFRPQTIRVAPATR